MVINDRARMLLYQITNSVVQLTEAELNNALDEVPCTAEEMIKFKFAINEYRLDGSHLMLKKRHPVLLILDEVQNTNLIIIKYY